MIIKMQNYIKLQKLENDKSICKLLNLMCNWKILEERNQRMLQKAIAKDARQPCISNWEVYIY